MSNALEYIKEVCNRERERFKGTNFDGPFIGIAGVLPELEKELSPPEAILVYTMRGSRAACGQQVGADGAGMFAKLFYGESAYADAVELSHKLRTSGRLVEHSIIEVPNLS